MAGPSIKVSFLSDFSKLRAGISDVAGAAKAGGSSLKDAFAPALAVLNRSGVLGPFKEALDGVGESISQVKEHIHDLPMAMAAAGAGVAGIGVALTAIGSKDQAAHAQLQASVEATGHSYEDYAKGVEQAIKHQEKFGFTASQTQDALRVLTQATGDPTKALQYLNTATDLAAAKHESLTSAAGQMAKAYNGSTRIFKEFGIQVVNANKTQTALTSAQRGAATADKALAAAKQHLNDLETIDAAKKKLTTSEALALRNAQAKVTDATKTAVGAHEKLRTAQEGATTAAKANGDAMTTLAGKLKGQGSAAADTFTGRLKEVKAKIEDNVAALGQKYGPALQAAGAGMAGLGAALKIGQGAMEAAKAAALGTRIELGLMSAATKVATAAQWLLNIAMDANPIVLIVIAIAALVAILILVLAKTGLLKDAWNDVKKVADIVWHGILTAVKAVWDWIKANWPLLLGILLGPIALAAALIYKYWDSIKAGLVAVWNWIRTTWNSVYTFLVTPIQAAIHWIATAWGAVTSTISGVVRTIQSVWAGLYGSLTGTISAAVGWIRGAWGSITGAVQGVVNTIEGLFNGLVGFVSGLPGRIAGIASNAFGSLVGAARNAVNGVINVWNAMASHTALNFSVGGQKVGPVSLPKLDVHTGQLIPDIPHLAQGGIITQTGLVLAHAGEAITPIPGRMAPAVNVENAYFATELDVDSFMRQAAWHVRRQAV